MDTAAKALAPGSLVELMGDDGSVLGTGYFNPHSLIAGRVLAPRIKAEIDGAFFRTRIERAKAARDKLVGAPFYRLIHSEADGLPGLIVERFDDVLVAQSGTAGMDRLEALWLQALIDVFDPRAIVIKSDAPARAHEGLKEDIRVVRGSLDGGVRVVEGGVTFRVDPIGGQKTGWFFDQRDNRAFLATLAKDASVLDAYSYVGALGLIALKAGARRAVMIDSSEAALTLGEETARANGLDDAIFKHADVYDELERLTAAGEPFDIVSCDPPPFVRSKKDLEAGAKGYRKLARLAAPLVTPGGFLFIASCSHAIDAARFQDEVSIGIARSGRTGRIVRASGAATDHPVHPHLPETAYLKALVYQLD